MLPRTRITLGVVDGPEVQWMVRRMRFVEALSEPYLAELELVSEELGADSEGMLGARVELTLERGDGIRSVCGIVHLVEFIGVADDRLQIRVEVVPAWRLSEQRVDTRLWQHAKVPDVIAEVLGAALADYQRRVEVGNLRATYREREAIVQYHESDREFVSRLMEEEGISYWFDHERDEHAELMVLEDGADHHADVATLDDDPTLRIIVDRADNAEIESIQYFDWTRELTSTALHQRVFDWLNPRTPIEADAPGPGQRDSDARGRIREVYEHGRFVEADPGPRTIRKLQQLGSRDAVARGVGNVLGMTPGRKFTLVDHQRPDLDREYLIRRVVHIADWSEQAPHYENRFECVVFDPAKPFRPARVTAKPRIHGPQTAIVTGPGGEEIHTDEHGRIKVRFDWDRVNALTDDTSMWIRVAHHWAGPGFGTFFLPRVGMEVVVEFLEGDPAKPLVTGCVYDGDNHASIGLPESKTQSTIRTRSSPGSEGYNELRFEDAAGSEAIALHAQKDLVETIENDHRTTVHASQTQRVDGAQRNSVGGGQSESIGGSATLTIDHNRSVTIKGSQVVTILGEHSNTDVQGSKLGITGDYRVDASNMLEIQAPTHIKLVCGESAIVLWPDRIEITAGGSAKLVLDTAALMQSAAGSKLQLDADALGQSSAGSSLRLDADACLSSTGGSQVMLDDGAMLSGIQTAGMTAQTSTVRGDGGTLESNPAGIALSGDTVHVAATGITAISGATVKLN